jgi:hypothetical protein
LSKCSSIISILILRKSFFQRAAHKHSVASQRSKTTVDADCKEEEEEEEEEEEAIAGCSTNANGKETHH